MLRAGFATRTVAIAILTVAFLSQAGNVPLALVGFVITVMAWPLLGVSGTALAAEVAPGEKGEAHRPEGSSGGAWNGVVSHCNRAARPRAQHGRGAAT